MRILLVTSVQSPHLLPFAQALGRACGEPVSYVATRESESWRIMMGWPDLLDDNEIIRPYATSDAAKAVERLWFDADVVIVTERSFDKIQQRINSGKLTFYMSERWLKPPLGYGRLADPRWVKALCSLRRLSHNENFHYLPLGVYARKDMAKLACFGDRSWLFNYALAAPIPETTSLRASNPCISVLYAGRMIRLKRTCDIVRGFFIMKNRLPQARLTLVGSGTQVPAIRCLSEKLGIGSSVNLIPSQPMPEVWAEMSRSDIFVLASTGREGWGAVVNEAMSRGCVVVASNAAGAAATMIVDGRNGYLFDPKDFRTLGEILIKLGLDSELRHTISQSGIDSINSLWSAEITAKRFVSVAKSLLDHTHPPCFETGPMSQPLE